MLSFSALQRAENSSTTLDNRTRVRGRSFSALQRAENSSTLSHGCCGETPRKFQCSSASRKFLNCNDAALVDDNVDVSVLFSEPKIPQPLSQTIRCIFDFVSVLFSEPKIPQQGTTLYVGAPTSRFSALQRAENSSTPTLAPASIHISDRDDHASSFLSLPGASP